jgi:hypothetical protein
MGLKIKMNEGNKKFYRFIIVIVTLAILWNGLYYLLYLEKLKRIENYHPEVIALINYNIDGVKSSDVLSYKGIETCLQLKEIFDGFSEKNNTIEVKCFQYPYLGLSGAISDHFEDKLDGKN